MCVCFLSSSVIFIFLFKYFLHFIYFFFDMKIHIGKWHLVLDLYLCYKTWLYWTLNFIHFDNICRVKKTVGIFFGACSLLVSLKFHCSYTLLQHFSRSTHIQFNRLGTKYISKTFPNESLFHFFSAFLFELNEVEKIVSDFTFKCHELSLCHWIKGMFFFVWISFQIEFPVKINRMWFIVNELKTLTFVVSFVFIHQCRKKSVLKNSLW